MKPYHKKNMGSQADSEEFDIERPRDFEALFKKYYFLLTRFAWRYVHSKAVAEELVQEVFAHIWEHRGEWEARGSVKTYLYRSVKHRSIDYLKHQKVRDRYDAQWMDQQSTPVIRFQDRDREEKIRRAIRKAVDDLPQRGKMVYKLHRHDGLTYEEIAEVMGISVKTVESQMSRSLKTLREKLSFLLTIILTTILTALGS